MKRGLAAAAVLTLVLAAGCDDGNGKSGGCKKSPTPKAMSQVLVKPGPGGGGRPGGGAKGGGAKPVKPKGGNGVPRNGTNGDVQPAGCR